MTPPMTRASRPRLASLGMLVWWAATSSAMPPRTPAGAPHEADGPDAHKLSLQPVGRGAHLDFERRRATETCLDMDNDENWCCKFHITRRNAQSCGDISYGQTHGPEKCHKFFYWNGAPPPYPPRTRCAAAREGSRAMPRSQREALPTVPQPAFQEAC